MTASVGGRVGDDHVLVGELGRPLEQAGVGVEDVARVRLAARRAAEQERQLAVGDGLLREVVVDAERRLALLVHEVLGHRAAGVGGEVLERGRVAGAGDDDDRVVHRAVLAEDLDQPGGRRLLLRDRDVDADDAGALLVEDRVDGDGGLARLAVADDQLALAAADRGHGVDRLDARSASARRPAAARRSRARSTRPAASRSVTIGPLLSIGSPSGLTTRPTIASPTGTRSSSPVAVTVSPSWILVKSPRMMTPTDDSSRLNARPLTPVLERRPSRRSSRPRGRGPARCRRRPRAPGRPPVGDLGLELLDLALDD